MEWGQKLTLLRGTEENVTSSAVCVKSSAARRPVLYLETQEDQTITKLNYTVLVNGRKRPIHGRRRGKDSADSVLVVKLQRKLRT